MKSNRRTEMLKSKALEALVDSKTITEAASKAGISRRALYDYLENDAGFARSFQAMQEQRVLDRLDGVEADRQKALKTVFALMNDSSQPGAVRLRAAQMILEMGEAVEQAARIVAKDHLNALGIADGVEQEQTVIIIRRPDEDLQVCP